MQRAKCKADSAFSSPASATYRAADKQGKSSGAKRDRRRKGCAATR